MVVNLINNLMDTKTMKPTTWMLTQMSMYLKIQVRPCLLKRLLILNKMGQHMLNTLQWEQPEFPFPTWVRMCHISGYCMTIWGQKTSGTCSSHSTIGNSLNG